MPRGRSVSLLCAYIHRNPVGFDQRGEPVEVSMELRRRGEARRRSSRDATGLLAARRDRYLTSSTLTRVTTNSGGGAPESKRPVTCQLLELPTMFRCDRLPRSAASTWSSRTTDSYLALKDNGQVWVLGRALTTPYRETLGTRETRPVDLSLDEDQHEDRSGAEGSRTFPMEGPA